MANECCERCEKGLETEELEHLNCHPDESRRLCDRCYDELYRDSCERCQESCDKEELSPTTGRLIGIWEEVDATPEKLQPGYYRVKAWPFYVSYMFGGHFYADKVERVADLDDQGKKVAQWSMCPTGPMCEQCREKVEASLITIEA